MQRDVDRHAFALVAVLRLDRHRHTDFQRSNPGIGHITDRAAPGHRHTGCAQQFFGQVLVLGDGFGHRAGCIQFGSLNTALAGTPAKLHHAAPGQAAVRNTARHCGVHNRAGTRPQALVFIAFAQLGHCVFSVKTAVVQRGVNQRLRQCHGQVPHRFFGVLHDNLVNARLQRERCVAERDGASGCSLQLQSR